MSGLFFYLSAPNRLSVLGTRIAYCLTGRWRRTVLISAPPTSSSFMTTESLRLQHESWMQVRNHENVDGRPKQEESVFRLRQSAFFLPNGLNAAALIWTRVHHDSDFVIRYFFQRSEERRVGKECRSR